MCDTGVMGTTDLQGEKGPGPAPADCWEGACLAFPMCRGVGVGGEEVDPGEKEGVPWEGGLPTG